MSVCVFVTRFPIACAVVACSSARVRLCMCVCSVCEGERESVCMFQRKTVCVCALISSIYTYTLFFGT